MAALMTLFGHVKDDIESLGENATLLKSAEYFCQAVDDLAKLQGTYLHYDTNDNKWINHLKMNSGCTQRLSYFLFCIRCKLKIIII